MKLYYRQALAAVSQKKIFTIVFTSVLSETRFKEYNDRFLAWKKRERRPLRSYNGKHKRLLVSFIILRCTLHDTGTYCITGHKMFL
ncbi:unnamed protein product [Nezara viridula]|uniref:Uncharacterized protein n=1 Tax=Nezara viridula TaxID=85310 RepID=A0A9P0MJQ4_NEZVI|nr:unnamed protein product [Nezara viridula]